MGIKKDEVIKEEEEEMRLQRLEMKIRSRKRMENLLQVLLPENVTQYHRILNYRW